MMKAGRPVGLGLGFLALLIVVLGLTAGGHIVIGDEETMYRLTRNLAGGRGLAVGRETLTMPAQSDPLFLPHQAVELPTTSAVPGRDGRLYSKYAPGQSLAGLPLYLLGRGLAAVVPRLPAEPTARLMVSFFNVLALAGCGWLMLHLGRALGYRRGTATWLALAFIFASMAWPYVKTFFPQPAVTLLLLVLVLAGLRWREGGRRDWLWLLGLAAAGLILFRLSQVVLLPLLALYLLTAGGRRGRLGFLALGLGAAAGLAASAGYNWLRFGSLWETGYHEVAWTTPPLLGLYGLLASPGKGVLLYTPLLLLAPGAWLLFVRRRRAEAWLFLGLWLVLLAVYAPYNFWTGGFNWGPRFLLPVLPLGLLPIGALLEQPQARPRLTWAVFLVLFLLGLGLQLPAVLVDHSRTLYQHLSGREESLAYSETIYRPADSPLRQQWPTAVALLRAYARPETRQAAGAALVALGDDPAAAGIPDGGALLQAEFERRNTPDLWWVHLLLAPLGPAAE